MKIVVIIGILVLLLADTFFLWCLLRANAIQEQQELRRLNSREDPDPKSTSPEDSNRSE